METNNTLTFKLPDGEVVVVSWDFIMSQISDFITGMTTQLQMENVALKSIEDTIDGWLEDQ
jgi:hypothetical protein